MTTVRFDLPTPEGDTIAFWEAAKDERLLIRHCTDCGAYSYYPAALLPEVLERERRVVRGQRRGDPVHLVGDLRQRQPPFKDRVPYVAAIVDLAEGPRMMTNVVDCPFEELAVGMALWVTFQSISDEFTIPVFVRA